MTLEDDVYWVAVRECSPPEALVQVLYGPRTTVREASPSDRLDRESARGFFKKGDCTFFVSPSDIFDVPKHFPDREVLFLCHAAQYSWASIAHYTSGTCDWSVYGSTEDEFLRIEGEPPEKAQRFLRAKADLDHVAVKIGSAILGFRHDKHDRPAGLHVIEVEPGRTLVVAGVETSTDPTPDQVREALLTRQPVTLTVQARSALDPGRSELKSMVATFDGGRPRVEIHARFKMFARKRRPEISDIDEADVLALFQTFYPRANHPHDYDWTTIKEPKL